MDEVFRQEKKFMVTVEEQKKYSHLLDEVLMQDAHNGAEGYVIRSLYLCHSKNKPPAMRGEGISLD